MRDVVESSGWFSLIAWTEGHFEMSKGSGGHSFGLESLCWASGFEDLSSGGRFECGFSEGVCFRSSRGLNFGISAGGTYIL